MQRHGAGGAFAIEAGPLGLASGGGRPLPEVVRGKMEAALGADFSNVRVHVGPQAERIGAIAFTLGSDIYFAPGRYQPNTLRGQQLLGHELTHVVQQRAGRVRNPTGSGLAVVQDMVLEAEADRLGRRAAARSTAAQAKTRPGAAQPSAPVRVSPPISAGPGSYRLTAGASGRQVGSVMVHARDRGAVEVTDLYVAQSERGHDIGRQLVASAARTGLQFGRSKMTLAAQDNGSRHLTQWYKGMGFAQVGVTEHGYPQLEAPISRVLTSALQQKALRVGNASGTIGRNPPIQRMKRAANTTAPQRPVKRARPPNLPLSLLLPDWRRGVTSGFTEGWQEAVQSEFEDAHARNRNLQWNPQVAIANQQMIADIRAHPPDVPLEINDSGFAFDEGYEWARGRGYDEGALKANMLFNWGRANYPAMTTQAKRTAMAMNHAKCVYCNVNVSTDADHVYPVQKHWITLGCRGHDLNRVNDQDNLVGACKYCNISKSNIYLDQWNGKHWQAGQWFPFLAQGDVAPPQNRGSPINNPANW